MNPNAPTLCPECNRPLIKIIINEKYELPCATCAVRQLILEQRQLESKLKEKAQP